MTEQEIHQYLHDVYINAYNNVLAMAHTSQRVAEEVTNQVFDIQKEALKAATNAVKNYKETFEGFNKPSKNK